MNTNNLEDIGESPDKFDAKRISTFFVSNLIRSGDFILNEKFLDMVSFYYGYSGKSFPEEVKKIIKNFLLNKKIKKKTIKKIVPLNIKYLKSPGCQPGSLLSSEENKIKKAAETAFLKPNLCEQAVSRVLFM